jgi:hypothetical protein
MPHDHPFELGREGEHRQALGRPADTRHDQPAQLGTQEIDQLVVLGRLEHALCEA